MEHPMKTYELIEAPTVELMNTFEEHTSDKIEPESYIIGSPIEIVRYILKNDLTKYKIIKKP